MVLLVLDPLLSMVDAGVNDYRAREVRDALEPLLPIADRTGCALFGLAHFTKAAGSDPLLLISGSGAFGQLVRAGIGYARDEDPPGSYVLSTIKSNLGREDLDSLAYRIEPTEVPTDDGPAWVSRLVFEGTAARSVRDLLRDTNVSDDDRTTRDEAAEFVRNFLTDSGGEAPARDVLKAAHAAGFAERTVQDARKRTPGLSTRRRGFGKDATYVWTMDAPMDAMDAHPQTHAPIAPMAAPMPTHPEQDVAPPDFYAAFDQSEDDEPSPPPGNPSCRVCGRANLFHPASIERGVCAACVKTLEVTA